MAYDTLIKTLLSEGEAKAREILEAARTEAEAILRSAKETSGREAQRILSAAQKRISAERSKRLSRARVQSQKIRLAAREAVIRRVLERAQVIAAERLSGPSKATERFWSSIVNRALAELSGHNVKAVIGVDGPEELKKVIRSKKLDLSQEDDPELFLGFRLVTPRLEITDGYCIRLDQVRSELRAELRGLLFDGVTGSKS